MKRKRSKFKKAAVMCMAAIMMAAISPVTAAGQTTQAIAQRPDTLTEAEVNNILSTNQWIIAADGNAMNAEGTFFLFFITETSAWNLGTFNLAGEIVLQPLTAAQSYIVGRAFGRHQTRHVEPPQPLPQPLAGMETRILIEGDARFVANTQRAIEIIRRSPWAYATVSRYIGIIRQGDSSGMWAWLDPPTFVVGRATYTASSTWYASTILHDAIHSKQYHNHLARYGYVPDIVWTGFYAEMEALEIQIEFLRQIGAPEHEIRWAESLVGDVWWYGTPWW